MTKALPSWRDLDPETMRPFSQIRLVAADLDGTLVRAGSSDPFKILGRLVRSLAHPRYDVKVTLATGRALAGVKGMVEDLALQHGVPLILYNGSVVVSNAGYETVWTVCLPQFAVRSIAESVAELPVTLLAYRYSEESLPLFGGEQGKEAVFGWSTLEKFEKDFNGLRVHWVERWDEVPSHDVSAILISSPDRGDVLGDAAQRVSRVSGVSVTRSGGTYIEIHPSQGNKARGLAVTATALGLRRAEVLAIGDNDNDVDMLRWASIGVCVGQASAAAYASSNYYCSYEVEKGAVEVLRAVRRARRYFHAPHRRTRGGGT